MHRYKFFGIAGLLILALLGFSCEENDELSAPQRTLQDGSSVEISVDQQRFNGYRRGHHQADPVSIRVIERQKDLIELAVVYPGGCEPHEFNFLWDGQITFPEGGQLGFPTLELYLEHNANGDMCEAALTDTLLIDLKDISETQNWDEVNVRVINGFDKKAYSTFALFPVVPEGEICEIDVVLEEVMCGYGLLGSRWFRMPHKIDEFPVYLQPINIGSFILLDPDLPNAPYKLGVRVVIADTPDDIAICQAFPGPSIPVEIYCIE